MLGVGGSTFEKKRSSRKLRYEEIIFVKAESIIFLYVLKYFDDKKGGVKVHYGSKEIKILKVPEII